MARKQAALKTTAKAAITMIALAQRQTGYIPFNLLKLSPSNARKVPPSAERIVNLAGQIKAQGLLHALHVTEEMENGEPTGFFLVEAGGRRWRALGWLVEHGYLADDELIECKLIEASEGNALGLSVAENITQEPMHAADEFAAIKAMFDKGDTVEEIAAFFATTVLHVQRRLKLAAVAPALFDQFREGSIALDQMMALATVDDHARQIATWEGLSHYGRCAQTIKNRLAQDEVISSDARVRFVGVDEYEAAGGKCRQDLFADDDVRYLLDPALLDSLVTAKLAKCAEEVAAEGWLWVDALLAYGYSEQSQYRPTPKVYLPETAEQAAQREALEADFEKREAKLESFYEADEDDEAFANFDADAAQEELDALQAKLDALKESRADVGAIDKAATGAVVTIVQGVLRIERGLIRKADAAKLAQQLAKDGNPEAAAAVTAAAGGKARAEVPESLMFNLTAHRTAAIQAAMLKNQAVALAAMANRIALGVFAPEGLHRDPLRVSVQQCGGLLDRSSPTMAESVARAQITEARSALESMLPEDRAEWLQWFIDHPAETLSMIAFGASQSVDTMSGHLKQPNSGAPLMAALGLDMADWWKADAGNYFSLVPKAKMVEAVREACGAEAVGGLGQMKKAEAVAYAAERVSATRWLPLPLRA